MPIPRRQASESELPLGARRLPFFLLTGQRSIDRSVSPWVVSSRAAWSDLTIDKGDEALCAKR